MHRFPCHLAKSLTLAVVTVPAWAASLHVAPVSLQMVPGQAAAGLTLSNPSDHDFVAQVRLFAWTQVPTEDQLSAQNDLVVSPPIATIRAHSEQVVRVVRLDKTVVLKERTYRLLIDELPASTATAGSEAVDIRIRYSVPLFIVPVGGPTEPQVAWDIIESEGNWHLRAVNSGGMHAQLSAVRLRRDDGTTLNLTDGLLGYALAGCSREWTVSAQGTSLASGPLQIQVVVNGHPTDSPVSRIPSPSTLP